MSIAPRLHLIIDVIDYHAIGARLALMWIMTLDYVKIGFGPNSSRIAQVI